MIGEWGRKKGREGATSFSGAHSSVLQSDSSGEEAGGGGGGGEEEALQETMDTLPLPSPTPSLCGPLSEAQLQLLAKSMNCAAVQAISVGLISYCLFYGGLKYIK